MPAFSRRAALRGAAVAIVASSVAVGVQLATPESYADDTERVDEI
jgi:hypothetical protein